MTPERLKTVLDELRLSQAEFARLVGVSVGAVSQWLSKSRGIPGPVEAFVDLFMRLPASMRETEITNLKLGTANMKDGMYLVHFVGSAGTGYATLTFENGRIYGFDIAGGIYDGVVQPTPEGNGNVIVDIKVKMPANQPSVVAGLSQPFDWFLPVKARMNVFLESGNIVIQTINGQSLHAKYQRMRDLPLAA